MHHANVICWCERAEPAAASESVGENASLGGGEPSFSLHGWSTDAAAGSEAGAAEATSPGELLPPHPDHNPYPSWGQGWQAGGADGAAAAGPGSAGAEPEGGLGAEAGAWGGAVGEGEADYLGGGGDEGEPQGDWAHGGDPLEAPPGDWGAQAHAQGEEGGSGLGLGFQGAEGGQDSGSRVEGGEGLEIGEGAEAAETGPYGGYTWDQARP